MKFKKFKVMVENETSRTIKCLKSDRDEEFTSDKYE